MTVNDAQSAVNSRDMADKRAGKQEDPAARLQLNANALVHGDTTGKGIANLLCETLYATLLMFSMAGMNANSEFDKFLEAKGEQHN